MNYEMVNQKIAAQKAVWRKDALRRLAFTLAIVLAVALAFFCLEYVGFISEAFLVILIAITICVGSFKAGYICRDIKF